MGLRPVRSQSPDGPLPLSGLVHLGQPITSDGLHDQLKAVYGPSSPAATAGVPQDGKDESEMVGVQASHETAYIFERLSKCEGLDECQYVALS